MKSVLPCCLPCGKAGELQILCCQGFEVNDYNFTLDALALKPSGFCNVRGKMGGRRLVRRRRRNPTIDNGMLNPTYEYFIQLYMPAIFRLH
jgi:hypothetical protein